MSGGAGDQGDICPKGGSINSALKLSIKYFPQGKQPILNYFFKRKVKQHFCHKTWCSLQRGRLIFQIYCLVFVHVWFIMCIFYPSESSNKHTGPVWQMRWVEQDRGATGDGKKERLICISADGRITEWFIQKRLDCIGKHFSLQLFCRGIIPEIAIA